MFNTYTQKFEWDYRLGPHERRMVRLIVAAVCDVFGTTWGAILGREYHPATERARYWLVGLLLDDGDFTKSRIEKIVQRTPQTVSYAIRRYRQEEGRGDTRAQINRAFTIRNNTCNFADDRDWYYIPGYPRVSSDRRVARSS